MRKIIVSGLLNIETTLDAEKFPIEYCPIEYRFFGINSYVSGVGTNISFALKKLSNEVRVLSLTGDDLYRGVILNEFNEKEIRTNGILPIIKATPVSLVLYDKDGKRKIYCDLKNIQENEYPLKMAIEYLYDCDIAVLCNINFNRGLLKAARELNKTIATDVHVLSNLDDEYNKDFLRYSQIVFLSDEGIQGDKKQFLSLMKDKYDMEIIVLGCGKDGALMYVRQDDRFYKMDSVKNDNTVNTVGAGDALFSGFINFYAKGFSPLECLKRAQVFASAKISFDGASQGFIDEDEIERRLSALSICTEEI